jgi:hypothetical protein
MTLYEKIMQIYPNLTDDDFKTVIVLQNDLNGIGDYIKEWNHSEYAKPSQEQIKD